MPVDTRYYEVHHPGSLGERLLVIARNRIYSDLVRVCAPRPDDQILDVGVSDVIAEGANFLERMYPHPHNITACGIGEAEAFEEAFPKVRYIKILPHAGLPFADQQFAIATSNAVVEHLGSRDNQLFLIQEMLRVARMVFISVPNRYFPVEHHTAIPFFHYADSTFRMACRMFGKHKWADPSNLILLSRSRLLGLLPGGSVISSGYTGLRGGPFSSNIFVAARKSPEQGRRPGSLIL